jgi:hypothetical protein
MTTPLQPLPIPPANMDGVTYDAIRTAYEFGMLHGVEGANETGFNPSEALNGDYVKSFVGDLTERVQSRYTRAGATHTHPVSIVSPTSDSSVMNEINSRVSDAMEVLHNTYEQLQDTQLQIDKNPDHEVIKAMGDMAETYDNLSVSPSSAQLAKAKQAWKLHHALGHPGLDSLSNSLNAGVILGCSATTKDLRLAYKLFGPCSHCLAGKITKPSYKPSLTTPVTSVGEYVHMDLIPLSKVSLGGSKFGLIVVDEFSGFLILITLNSKSTKSLERAITEVISRFKRHNHRIRNLITDSESNFSACSTFIGLCGIVPKQVPPYQHAQRMERYVRTINDRSRTILDSLNYHLPAELDLELIHAVVEQLNMLGNSTHPNSSPNIIVKGEKIDLRQSLPPAFGTPAMFHHAGKVQNKKITRSNAGIVLGKDTGSDNTMRSVRAYLFHTGEVVIRNTYDLYDNLPSDVMWKRKKISKLSLSTAGRDIGKNVLHITTLDNTSTVTEIIDSHDMEDTDRLTAQTINANIPKSYIDEPQVVVNSQEHNSTRYDSFGQTETIDDIQQSTDTDQLDEPDDIPDHAATEDTAVSSPDILDVMVDTPNNDNSNTNVRKRTNYRDNTRLNEDYVTYVGRTMEEVGYNLSVKTALTNQHAAQNKAAIIDEIKNWIEFKVGHPVKRVPREHWNNVLRSFMFLKEKYKPDNRFDKTKARMVVNGAGQDTRLYDFISSTTVNLAAVFLLFNIASCFKARLATYDIKGAFLHAKFDHHTPMYVIIPKEVASIWCEIDPTMKEFLNEKGELILELDKYAYGLKQSPLKFQQHLRKVLVSLGYAQLDNDDCVYIKVSQGHFSIISTHVDDILQVATHDDLVNELHAGLIKHYKEVTFNPKAESYLGMSIEQSDDRSTIKLNMKKAASDLVEKYLTPDTKIATSPAAADLFDQDDGDNTGVDAKAFLSIVMSLMYLARLTRPDILLAVTYLATKGHNPSKQDLKKLHRVLRYLKGTIDLGVTIHCTDMQIYCHCDASYGAHANGTSHTGFVISIGAEGSYLHARSAKQKVGSVSSTDAEVIALVDCLKMVVWLRNLLSELDIIKLKTSIVYQDNKSAIFMVTEPNSRFRRSKHILTKISYARQLNTEGIVSIVWCDTKAMIADVLTKPLTGELFLYFIRKILGF